MFVLTSVPLFQCKPLQKPWGERRDAMQNIQDGGAKGCQQGCQKVWLVILKIASRNRMIAVKSSYGSSQKFVWLQSKVRMVAVESSYGCCRTEFFLKSAEKNKARHFARNAVTASRQGVGLLFERVCLSFWMSGAFCLPTA